MSPQDAKKSRLPILIKASRSLGNVYRLPATQELVTQLQGQVLELQGELKELKVRNRQLRQKLILAEAMTEGRPAPDKTLLKGKHREKCVLHARDKRPDRAARNVSLVVQNCGKLEYKFYELQ